MMPFAASPVNIAPTPVQASAVVGTPIESSIVRLPATAVSTTFNTIGAQNNSRNMMPLRSTAAAALPTVSGNFSGGFILLEENSSLPRVQYSTPFVAQLLSQAGSIGEAESLANIYANDNLPTVDPELMEIFSRVKYLPSNASLPQPKPMNVMAASQAEVKQQAMETQQAQQLQAAVFAARQSIVEPVQSVAATSAVPVAVNNDSAKAVSKPVLMEGPAPEESETQNPDRSITRRLMSLVKPIGVDAYIASFTRNHVHLGTAPNVQVAL